MNLKLESMLNQFQKKNEVGFLSVLEIPSNNELYSMEGNDNLDIDPEFIVSMSSKMNSDFSVDTICLKGKEKITLIKSLGESTVLVTSISSSDLGRARFFLTAFSLEFEEDEHINVAC